MKTKVEKVSKKSRSGNKSELTPDLFLSISENLREGVFRGDSAGKLVYVNPAFLNLFGYNNKQDLIHLNIAELCSDQLKQEQLKRKLLLEGSLKNETVQFRRKDGTSFWGLINCTHSKNGKKKHFYDGAIIDITEKRKSEELLRVKNMELNKINAQMDRFLYSASHDIRSPMTSIMGLVNILRMEIDSSKHEYLDKIDNSLMKLDHLMREVIQFSQNARTRIVSERIFFEQLIYQAWNKVNGEHSSIVFNVSLPDNNYYFYSDYNRLLIALSNILKNNIEFSDYEKHESWVHVSIRADINAVQIVIEDNGLGIGKAHVSKVFDMFYRANESSKGSGMGLYIVRETLEKIGGTIALKSTLNKGTTITLSVPNHSKGKLMSKKMGMSK